LRALKISNRDQATSSCDCAATRCGGTATRMGPACSTVLSIAPAQQEKSRMTTLQLHQRAQIGEEALYVQDSTDQSHEISPLWPLAPSNGQSVQDSKPTRMGTAKVGHSFDLRQRRWAGGYFNAIKEIQSILIEFDRPGSSTLRSSTQADFNLSTFFLSLPSHPFTTLTLWQAPSSGPPPCSGDSGSSAGPRLIPGLCPEAW
jgi:hypothetical protein